jgi:hypothetical protein
MGLGLYIDAAIPGDSRGERPLSGGELIDRLEQACRSRIDDPLLRRLARFRRVEEGSGLDLWLHPATEPVEFRVDGARLTCSAKTSPAGPGYHVYVVELLERVAPVAGVEWRWSDAEGGDECEYHESRSPDRVREHMLTWLRALARHLDGEDFGTDLCLSLPVGFSPVQAGAICTPLGPLDHEWPRAVASASASELEVLGAQFFAWWEPGLDARFWARYGSAVAWVDIPWHPPASDDEDWAYDAAVAAFDRSRALDSTIALPDLEIADLRRYRHAKPDDARAPGRTGIGYRRGLMRWQLTGAWSVAAPGYWYQEHDDDAVVLWFGDRTIRITTYRVDGVPGEQLLDHEDARGGEEESKPRVEWRSKHLLARGAIEWTDDLNGYWMVSGQVATDGNVCLATICYVRESDRPWAEETFRSISHPAPARD